MNKAHFPKFDLIRIFAFLCICIVHFNASVSGYDIWGSFVLNNSLIPNYWGGVYLGNIGNGLFFLLSGTLLGHTSFFSNISISELKFFYIKRIKVIFPLYWIAFWGATFLSLGPNFFDKPLRYLLVSFLGLDGYALVLGFFNAGQFYKVGEWFLGCILCIYLIWPFFSYLFNKSPLGIGVLVLGSCFYLQNYMNPVFIIFWLPYFILGMVYIKFWKTVRNNLEVLIFTVSIIFLRIIFDAQLGEWSKALVLDWTIFYVILYLCEICPIKNQIIIKKLSYFSFMTYPVFLVHHQVIYHLCKYFDLTNWAYWKTIMLFIVYAIITILLAKFIVYIKDKICYFMVTFIFERSK